MFVFGGVFQGLGNTWPSLLASALRASAYIAPALVISSRPSFALHTIWLVSVASVLFQLLLQQAFLRRELRVKAPV
ncbi:MAG TPA: hypothetical protein VJN18_33865 [Polyangiaceae bacterium]|nr:hypothetical protein [Polyangiaceae bacterium]